MSRWRRFARRRPSSIAVDTSGSSSPRRRSMIRSTRAVGPPKLGWPGMNGLATTLAGSGPILTAVLSITTIVLHRAPTTRDHATASPR